MSRSRMIPIAAALVVAWFLTFFSPSAAHAQQGAQDIKRSVLEKDDLSVPGREGLFVQVEFAPGAKEPRHTHPGDLFGYVKEGSLALTQEGKPVAHLKPGDVFFIPAGRIHTGANEGATVAKVLVTFFVEKGKPITSPAQWSAITRGKHFRCRETKPATPEMKRSSESV